MPEREKIKTVLPEKMGGPKSKIDQPATDVAGNPATAAEGIVSRIRAGAYLEAAAAAVDVHRDTVYSWMKTGSAARTKVLSGFSRFEDLRPHEQRCMAFLAEMEKAEAEWLIRAEAELERIVRGGQTTRTVTVRKDGKGNVIETIEKEEHVPPDPRVIQWRLERRYPEKYGRRQVDVNLGGQADNPIITQVDTDSILDKLKLAAGAAIDVTEATDG